MKPQKTGQVNAMKGRFATPEDAKGIQGVEGSKRTIDESGGSGRVRRATSEIQNRGRLPERDITSNSNKDNTPDISETSKITKILDISELAEINIQYPSCAWYYSSERLEETKIAFCNLQRIYICKHSQLEDVEEPLKAGLDDTRLWWVGVQDRLDRRVPDSFPFSDMRTEGSLQALENYIDCLGSMNEIERLEFCNKELERFVPRKGYTMLGNDAITRCFWNAEKKVLEYYIAVKELYPDFSIQHPLMNNHKEFKTLIRKERLKKEEERIDARIAIAEMAVKTLTENKPKSLKYYLRYLDVVKHSDLLEIAETAMKKGDWEKIKEEIKVVLSVFLLTFSIFIKAALTGFSSVSEILIYASLILFGGIAGIFLGDFLGRKEEQRVQNAGIRAMQEKLLAS